MVMLIDLALAVLAFILAYHIRDSFTGVASLGPLAPFRMYQSTLYFMLPVWFFVFRYFGFYSSQRIRTLSSLFWMVLKAVFVAVVIFAAFIFFFKAQFFSRTLYLLFFLFNLTLLTCEKWTIRLTQSYLREKGYNYRNCILVGNAPKLKTLIELMNRHQEWGIRIEGVVSVDTDTLEKEMHGCPVIGHWKELPHILKERVVDEVVFAVPYELMDDLKKHVWECEEIGINVRVVADFITPSMAKTKVDNINGIPLITFTTTPHDATMLFAKRCMDVVVSALGMMVLSPVFLVIAVAIKVTSPGPVFFKQKRVGKNGRLFQFYKFRSMYKDAEERKKELEKLNEMSGPAFKIKDDPRVSRVGRFLRRTSLDETPQFLNVLRGDMSLVGPRPPLPDEVKQYDPWQRRRLSMKPGLTCFWQIEGRNVIGFGEWMKLDLKYIDHWSLGLDIRILLKTVPAVLRGRGAS